MNLAEMKGAHFLPEVNNIKTNNNFVFLFAKEAMYQYI